MYNVPTSRLIEKAEEERADIIALSALMSSAIGGRTATLQGSLQVKHEDYLTPIEPKFAAEVAHATAGVKREDANEIVKALLQGMWIRSRTLPWALNIRSAAMLRRESPLRDA